MLKPARKKDSRLFKWLKKVCLSHHTRTLYSIIGGAGASSIQLKVKNAEGKEVLFKLKMTTPLRKV